MKKRIMFAGPSGIGKTTLAKLISKDYSMEFISGSVSDLLPSTKDMNHKEMLERDSVVLFNEDFQVLNLRNQLYKNKQKFVTDRSYLDVASYCLYKQADKMPKCEIEHFIDMARMLLNQQCDLLVLLTFPIEAVDQWVTEDNNKRIVSNYFQLEISKVMETTLRLMGYKKKFSFLSLFYPEIEFGRVNTIYGSTDVLIISEMNLELREEILKYFI